MKSIVTFNSSLKLGKIHCQHYAITIMGEYSHAGEVSVAGSSKQIASFPHYISIQDAAELWPLFNHLSLKPIRI